ncbi:MAG TPA: pitrilysin family protein [Blastocatellia bacterium]|nr:pitrilysin family protein [Blastocatellia bacterium]
MQSSEKLSARPRLDVERVELPNGLVLLLSENHSTPSVSINAIVLAGSRFEPDEKAGLASLVGDLLDEGTGSRSGQQIAETVEAVGGRLATFGEYQTSGVVSAFLSKDVQLGVEIVSDVLINAIFPEDKVRQRVARRLAQIKSRLDVPRTQASDIFNEIVFKGTPQHRPAVGYEATVRNLTRDDIVDFYSHYYVPNNAMVAVVGDINKADVKNGIEEAFGAWPRAADFKAPRPPAPRHQAGPVTKYVFAPKEQVNIFIGHVGVERANPDYYALLVMDTILGSSPGFTSRIPRILRDEMGLAYTTFANMTSSAGLDAGRFVAYIGTSPENLERAIAGLRAEIERIAREPVSEHELDVAKNYLTGSFVFHFQKNSQIADFLAQAEMYNLGFDYLERFPEMIRAVTIDDITRVAREYLHPERLVTVVVGPVDERGRIINRDNLT